MLIQFSVKNFRSLKDEQVFSLVAGKSDELLGKNTFEVPNYGVTLLRSTAIYGANASGKSNLLNAVRFVRKVVVGSARDIENPPIGDLQPFKLNELSRKEPSEFEVIFAVDGIKYQYGFSASRERIVEEWLIATPNSRPQKWFHRVWVDEASEYAWKFGQGLTGQKKIWANATKEKALFLSTAAQLNSGQLGVLYGWFLEKLRIGSLGGWNKKHTSSICHDGYKDIVLEFLKDADTGIEDIEVKDKKISVDQLPDEIPNELKTSLVETINEADPYEIYTYRTGSDGERVRFEFNEESEGTQMLFAHLGPWIDALSSGMTLFVDELNTSLHPKMVEYLVSLFNDNIINISNAQLVFTTHETSILSQDIMRRDQIWFCEKRDQESVVYPLSDFKPRKNRDNIELAYLAGRYGALPKLKKPNGLDYGNR